MHKHDSMNKFKTKEDKMKIDVHNFQVGFKYLVGKGFCSFWDNDGKLMKKDE